MANAIKPKLYSILFERKGIKNIQKARLYAILIRENLFV